ncbi:hypothetical protein HHSLTHF2_23840 [Vreelandella venusta]|uniref:IS30 family transposase n=1 Tax=Halomonas hydrothermalis TaxID=115561 RepID=A0A6F8U5N5_9GAMM|nr:hypothetical protein HHSLTHF2_23840 [Halomonas hydrothermalis]
MPGHWKGNLINGSNCASAVGTLIELSSGYLILAKMDDATVTSEVVGFSAVANRIPTTSLKSIIYGQSCEMGQHAKITHGTGVAVYFCDPHSLWQRGANENINNLIRQYLPKEMDSSVHF